MIEIRPNGEVIKDQLRIGDLIPDNKFELTFLNGVFVREGNDEATKMQEEIDALEGEVSDLSGEVSDLEDMIEVLRALPKDARDSLTEIQMENEISDKVKSQIQDVIDALRD